MNPPAGNADPIANIEARLTSQAARDGFDMIDDELDLQALKPIPVLHDALEWLTKHVKPEWVTADDNAKKDQKSHERLAHTAVFTGVGAIIAAVLQLALKLGRPDTVFVAEWTEIAIALAGLVAVGLGLKAKWDQQWLGWRHRAERLRMLKFRALAEPSLWSGRLDAWKIWVSKEKEGILVPDRDRQKEQREELERWSKKDTAEGQTTTTAHEFGEAPVTRHALAVYYRHKRLSNQAVYFDSKWKEAASSWSVRMRAWREHLFFVTIGFVILHVAAGYLHWENVALWGVALAAVLPVVGLGVRAWSAVFELSRKARSFAAKHRAMKHAAHRLGDGEDPLPVTLNHIRHNELFLEQEHREWLRLLLDAEWFL